MAGSIHHPSPSLFSLYKDLIKTFEVPEFPEVEYSLENKKRSRKRKTNRFDLYMNQDYEEDLFIPKNNQKTRKINKHNLSVVENFQEHSIVSKKNYKTNNMLKTYEYYHSGQEYSFLNTLITDKFQKIHTDIQFNTLNKKQKKYSIMLGNHIKLKVQLIFLSWGTLSLDLHPIKTKLDIINIEIKVFEDHLNIINKEYESNGIQNLQNWQHGRIKKIGGSDIPLHKLYSQKIDELKNLSSMEKVQDALILLGFTE